MQKIIKKIRTYMNISQKEFAEKIGVTVSTVNRWEKGAAPTENMAEGIYSLCVKNNIPAYDMIIDEIKAAADSIVLEENRILLYHGSKSGINGRIMPKSRDKCDFGKGFYMETEPSQPLTLICDYPKSKFYIVSLDLKNLDLLNVEPDLEWAMLIAYNRGKMDKIKGTGFYKKYRDMSENKDLIVGSIANDRMFYVIDNFFNGNITDTALVNSLSALKLGKQYAVVTQKGCDAVRIEKELDISGFEKRFLRTIADKNRKSGVDFANRVCKDYRREGRFFDEILDDAL